MCTLIAEARAHQPLRLVEDLIRNPTWGRTKVAAAVLRQLADDHNLEVLVNDTLRRWVTDGPASGQWVAAIVYTSPFGLRDPEHAFTQLRTILRSKWTTPNVPVTLGFLEMLADADRQRAALETAVRWSPSGGTHPGIRLVTTWVGLIASGAYRRPGIDADELVRLYPEQIRRLLEGALVDPEVGRDALDRLHLLATKVEFDRAAADDLVRVTSLLVRDLRWPLRLFVVRKLGDAHPRIRSKIRWTFRVARKVQRERSGRRVSWTSGR